jgi:hypothetical protein
VPAGNVVPDELLAQNAAEDPQFVCADMFKETKQRVKK